MNLNRLIVAEAPRIPEVVQQFWKLGPGRSRAFLAEFFDRQIERGLLRMPDSRAGAEYFLEMLSGTVRLQCLIGLRQPPTPREIEEIVQGAVAQFLNGCLAAPIRGPLLLRRVQFPEQNHFAAEQVCYISAS